MLRAGLFSGSSLFNDMELEQLDPKTKHMGREGAGTFAGDVAAEVCAGGGLGPHRSLA